MRPASSFLFIQLSNARAKRIKKAQTLAEYEVAVSGLLG